MNRVARKGKSKAGSRRKSKANSFQHFIKQLENEYGAFRFEPGSRHASKNQIAVVYDSKIPPRMPSPKGPVTDAKLSMTQYVAGSDMTLPTGTAIVGGLLRQNSASDVFASWAFALADIPNITAVASLFDQYRIDKIHFRLRSRNPALFMMNQASPNYSATTPVLVLDRDDNTAPTTLAELKQYENCQVISACDSIDIIFEPSYTRSVFAGGVFSGYEVVTDGDGWLDVANTGIPHYGLKCGIPALVAATTSRLDWDVEAWYGVSFLTIR
jgi:hypothetical protein